MAISRARTQLRPLRPGTTDAGAETWARPPTRSVPPTRTWERAPVADRRYRPGLDGLRALAIIGVLLYHAGVGWVPGGVLGVDLFFVVSGFLITSLLIAELQNAGRIGLGPSTAGGHSDCCRPWQ